MGEPMCFSEALKALKMGNKVTNVGWDKGVWIELQLPDKNSRMTMPYIYIHTTAGALVPWTASQADLLSEGWWIVTD